MRRVLLLALVACGDNTIAHAPYEARSGSRLALRIFEYEDGTRQWDPTSYIDRELGERCTVQRWSDGFTYCTPTARPTVFTDASCTTGELGRWLATQPAPDYFYREHAVLDVDAISRLFQRGEPAAAPATTYEIANGRCIETQAAGWNYFSLGDELAHERFARVRHVSADGTERLGMDTYESDDGLYVPIWSDRPILRDRALDSECKLVERPNSPTTTCEPAIAGEAEFSHDAQCTAPDIMVVEATTPVPDVIVLDDEGCKTFAQRGPEIAHGLVFLPVGESCVAVNPPTDAHLYTIGPPFAVPTLQRIHEPGDRRLRRILLTDGAVTVVDSLLFDSALGVDCTRTLVGTTLRCVPANTFAMVQLYYSDEQCTAPIEISLVEAGACDPPTRFAIDHRGSEPAVRPLVAPYAAPLYEISTGETCLPYIPPPRRAPFTVGAALPAEMFAAAELVTN